MEIYIDTNICKKKKYIYIHKFNSKCHSQTAPSSEREHPESGNVFSRLY